MAGATSDCCRLSAFHVTSRHFMKSHMRWVHECLAVTCHLLFGHNDRDLSRVTAVTRRWNGYKRRGRRRRRKSAQKVEPGEKNSPAAPAVTRTRDLSITSPCGLTCLLAQVVRASKVTSANAVNATPLAPPPLVSGQPTSLCPQTAVCTATAATVVWNSGSAVISLSRAGAPGVNTGLARDSFVHVCDAGSILEQTASCEVIMTDEQGHTSS